MHEYIKLLKKGFIKNNKIFIYELLNSNLLNILNQIYLFVNLLVSL